METCELHNTVAESLATIKADLAYIKENFSTHIVEANKPGGRHDRLLLAEQHITELNNMIIVLKRQIWTACVVAGVIGGLLAKAAPDFFAYLTKLIQ